MALHHVATVGLAVLSLLSLVLSLLSLVMFRAIGPPPQPRALPGLSRAPSFSPSPLLKPPPPHLPLARSTSSAKPHSIARRLLPWPTTLAVGSLWAIKARCPHWGQSPHSYDVSRELLAFTPGTDGLGDVVASILTLGLSEQHVRQRDPTLGMDLDLPPIILKTCAIMYVSRTLLLCPSFPLFGSLGFYSLGIALAYASIAPELPMWGFVGFEAATSLHDLIQPSDTPWHQPPTRQGALKAILRVTTAALVVQEQGCRRWQRAQRRVMRALPPVRATPVGNGSRRAEEDEEEEVGVFGSGAVASPHSQAPTPRRALPSMKRRPKTQGRGSTTNISTTTTIRVGAAARPSSRPAGPVKGSGSAEKSSLG